MAADRPFPASEVHDEGHHPTPGPVRGREHIQDADATKMRGKHPSEPAEGPDSNDPASESQSPPLAKDPHGAHPDDPAEGSPETP